MAAKKNVSMNKAAPGGAFFSSLSAFWADPPPSESVLERPQEVRAQFLQTSRAVKRRLKIIVGLILLNLVLAPLLRPIHRYMAVTADVVEMPLVTFLDRTASFVPHEKKTKMLAALFEPNQTDQAVLSWAATSITEIMTFGFGDIDQRLLAQRARFTDEGWKSFIKALAEQDVRESFKLKQLVLTAVPTDSPVIVSKGAPLDSEYDGVDSPYQWIVEMPVIMTYATNNNVSLAQKGIVRLTIAKVSGKRNRLGLGIKEWQFL